MKKEFKYNVISWILLLIALVFLGLGVYAIFALKAYILSLLFTAICVFFTEVSKYLDKKYRSLKAERKIREFYDKYSINNLNEFDHE